MNDHNFSESRSDQLVFMQSGIGTLVFSDPTLKDEGFYKCFASNRVGTAVTDDVNLRPASELFYIKQTIIQLIYIYKFFASRHFLQNVMYVWCFVIHSGPVSYQISYSLSSVPFYKEIGYK